MWALKNIVMCHVAYEAGDGREGWSASIIAHAKRQKEESGLNIERWKIIWIGWDFVNLEMDIKLANPLPFD